MAPATVTDTGKIFAEVGTIPFRIRHKYRLAYTLRIC